MQDKFRDKDGDLNKLCQEIIIENDRRFRVKKKINNIANSELKEQKGYDTNKAFVLSHMGLGDSINTIGMVRYLSTYYDKVVVACFTHNLENIKLFFKDDKDIELYPVKDDSCISPRCGFSQTKFNEITKGMDLYVSGYFAYKKTYCVPFSFYEDVKIPTLVFWDYFYIPKSKLSEELYSVVKGKKYAFVHNVTSHGEAFDIDSLNLDMMIINPCKNVYDKNHEHFNIAQKFVMKRLPEYIDTIINADTIILSDSSFLCMSLNLDIKTEKCYYKPRNPEYNYDYFYDGQYSPAESLKKPVFKEL